MQVFIDKSNAMPSAMRKRIENSLPPSFVGNVCAMCIVQQSILIKLFIKFNSFNIIILEYVCTVYTTELLSMAWF